MQQCMANGCGAISLEHCKNKPGCLFRGGIGRDPLLTTRESTHGDYSVQAAWAQSCKELLRATPNFHRMPKPMRESIDMIATKLSRLTHGDYNHVDTWDDISGYAKLGKENIRG